MSDMTRLAAAERIISENDIDKAWAALYWIFCSTDLETMGFYQTATRLGISAEQFKNDLLDRSQLARDFYFGAEGAEEMKEDV